MWHQNFKACKAEKYDIQSITQLLTERIRTNFPVKQVLLQMYTLIIFHYVVSYSFCTIRFQGEKEGAWRKKPAHFGLHWKLLGITCSASLSIGGNNSPENRGLTLHARRQHSQSCVRQALWRGSGISEQEVPEAGFIGQFGHWLGCWQQLGLNFTTCPQHSPTLITEMEPLPRQSVSLT